MKTEPYDGTKAWLRRFGELQRDADRLWDRLDELRARVESARTAHLDGLPHGSRGDADRFGGIVVELEETEAEATEAQVAATSARREISAAIRQIHGPRWADRREILRLRYLNCMKWEDCAERMFGDSQDFWDRQDAYLRRAYKLHSQALEALAQFVLLQTGQENNTLEDDRK